MKIRIYRKHKDIPLPERKTEKSAGLDVYAAERAELFPGKAALISTGLIIEAPAGYFYKIHIRSGLAVKNGICLANDVGIIDEDYRIKYLVDRVNTTATAFLGLTMECARARSSADSLVSTSAV